jgi:DNA-directed RNA polymerase specialized sigma24 family protein
MDRKNFYQIPESNEQHRDLRWHVDPRLKRYIDRRIPADCLPPQVLEIAQILVEEVRQLPLDCQNYTLPERNLSGCITALLAHILFSEQKVRLVGIVETWQRHFQGAELRDVYQVGLFVISRPSKFLGSFQSQVDWYASLCRYSHNKFRKSSIDELRRLEGDNFKRTNLGLLNRCSPSRLETFLKRLGEKGQQLDRLLLLHQCFQETITAKQFITNVPQPVHYDALLARYRKQKEETDLEIADRDEVKKLLADLSNIVRHDRQPSEQSLDAPLSNDNDSGTFGDLVADPAEIVLPEHRQIRELALESIRKNALDRIFWLLYGLGLTQAEAGKELDCHQSTIGRQHDREIARLAKELYLGDRKLPPATQLSVEILDEYIKYIQPLCEDYYAELALELWAEVSASMTTASPSIVERFIERVETQWQFKFKPQGMGLGKVDTFVQQQQHRGKWDREEEIHPSLRLND